MKILLCLVGLQGSGKTTLLNSISGCLVLRPSTNRPKRDLETDEYYFEEKWESDMFVWQIYRNSYQYGMRK